MPAPGLYADLVVSAHLLYLLFTVGGEIAIIAGGLLEWNWIRNRLFRLIHLIAVILVSIEAVAGLMCPLTELEYQLRRMAGQSVEEEISLLGRIVRSLLFYDFPAWVFTAMYIGFGAVVVGSWMIWRPHTGKAFGKTKDRRQSKSQRSPKPKNDL